MKKQKQNLESVIKNLVSEYGRNIARECEFPRDFRNGVLGNNWGEFILGELEAAGFGFTEEFNRRLADMVYELSLINFRDNSTEPKFTLFF